MTIFEDDSLVKMNGATSYTTAQSASAVPTVYPTTSKPSGELDSVNQQDNSASHMPNLQESQTIGQQILQVILINQEPEKILSSLALTIGEYFQANFCFVIAGSNLETRLGTGWWCSDSSPHLHNFTTSWLLSQTQITETLTNREPQAIEEKQLNGFKEKAIPWQSIWGITTTFPTSVDGIIWLGYDQPHQWSDLHKNQFRLLGEPVAVTLAQVKLQQQAQTRARYQILLNELNEEIASLSNQEAIIEVALRKTAQALQADGTLALMLKYNDPLFNRYADTNHIPQAKAKVTHLDGNLSDETVRSQQSFSLEETPVLRAAFQQSPEPLVINNQQGFADIGINNGPTRLFNPEQTSALLIVPLVGNHSVEVKQAVVLGFLVFSHHQPHQWQSEEMELSKWVANQISTAIIHHQTLHRVQLLVEERTVQLKRSLEVQAKLYEKTRQHVEQLRHLNQLKDEFLSTVQDELKHPLTKMKMAIEMLKIAPDSDKRQRHLEILESECIKEINLVNDLLTLQKLESHQYQTRPQKLDLKPLVRELVDSFEQEWHDKQISLVVDYQRENQPSGQDKSLMLYSDPDSLSRILLELLNNAGKFSQPKTKVNLQVSHQVSLEGDHIRLNLTNIGPGISPEEQEYIFDKFRRGKNVNDGTAQGTGLGLALVKFLVEHLNGTITVSSSPQQQSGMALNSFTLTLPRRLEG